MPIHATGHLLVNVPPGALESAHLRRLPADTVPLYPEERSALGVDLAPSTEWFIHTPPRRRRGQHPWDEAHEFVRQTHGALGTESVRQIFVEPDLIHRRYLAVPEGEVLQARDGGSWPAGADLDRHYPPQPGDDFSPAWHLQRAGFPGAWRRSKGEKVRIAHLDTGWDPQHASRPLHVFPEQGHNYYDGNADVVDHGDHLNPGHGVATLALLAGGHVDLAYTAPSGTKHAYSGILGGAPEADIVPVRIGGVLGSVIHLYSRSMALGLHHALGTSGRAPCDLVSLSHGGLPTGLWAHAVNDLYEKGIVVAAASGDSFYAKFLDIATHFTVYPSAWWRVITVTGETFSHGPYTTKDLFVMQGSWGPMPIMNKALGAYTPNVPWMRLGSPTAWDMNGGGTSASTPQVAAACALWMANYLERLPRDWKRVEAVRYMLFAHLADPELNFEKIGRGALSAVGLFDPALSETIANDAALEQPKILRHVPPDTCSWPFFRLLFGLPPPKPGVDEMYEVEAMQLAYRTPDSLLHGAMATYPKGVGIPAQLARTLRESFVREPDMSRTLRAYLRAFV